MPKRTQKVTSVYTPGLSKEFVFKFFEAPEWKAGKHEMTPDEEVTASRFPVGIIDGWASNVKYQTYLEEFKLHELDAGEILELLRNEFEDPRKKFANELADRIRHVKCGYEDPLITNVSSFQKDEIWETITSF